jgi:hypothetical protein
VGGRALAGRRLSLSLMFAHIISPGHPGQAGILGRPLVGPKGRAITALGNAQGKRTLPWPASHSPERATHGGGPPLQGLTIGFRVRSRPRPLAWAEIERAFGAARALRGACQSARTEARGRRHRPRCRRHPWSGKTADPCLRSGQAFRGNDVGGVRRRCDRRRQQVLPHR